MEPSQPPDAERVWDFRQRDAASAKGAFYVNGQCLDCVLCRETAPGIFARNDVSGLSYVARQPETSEEIIAAMESMEGCCTGAIQEDGWFFDWEKHPPMSPWSALSDGEQKVRSAEEAAVRRRQKPKMDGK